ncbi:hypothetical protein [Lyngbya sp. PCC 8106]|uniref:hypothetical protein n=1 Tax=Lyngbya sp. (strain PCC 8106) TaxID=313612 RepID=UPI0000EA9B17|nr:hypothetical protein [Lyngbya sp. PCC 8106]EAW35858.1 hypothetical protein L8106_02747 [Lyngbya sp. PCC 8106]
MAVKKSKGLGSNPLDRGIFSKTDSQEESEDVELKSQESRELEPSTDSQESRVKDGVESKVESQESRFLNREQAELKGTNVRLPIELIDWVDDLVKQGSRDQNKSRIPKEVWFQAALELFKAMPVDWDDISNEDELQNKLKSLESIIKNL